MHYEVGAILYDALILSVRELAKTEPAYVELERICSEQKNVPMVTCPERFEAELTSDILFPLADRFPALSPPQLAAHMADWCAKNAAQYLSLTPSQLGHLNVQTTRQFQQSLLKCFSECDIRAMFSPALLFYRPRVEGSGIEKWSTMASPDWSQLASAAKNSHNPDLRKLVKEFPSLENPPERMVSLALLADPELSVDAFLARYQGRENVPWYIRRFLTDSENFLRAAGRSSGRANGQAPDQGRNVTTDSLLEAVLGDFTKDLLRFRAAVARASAGEPALLFGQMMRLMQDFYRFFNHPSLRIQIQLPQDSQLPIESLVELARNCVRRTLHLLGLV